MISGSQNEDIIYGNGYVKGSFDMVNRYMAGDWKHYYFEIDDKTINTGTFDISWQNDETSLSAFMFDPQGRIVQTNVPSGVFGHFMGWPSIDWLGTTPFSQGGGFFPVKNRDETSSVMSVPINQTGTYTLLVHSTLFGGQSTTEPISVAAKFTSLLHDDKEPQILLSIPNFVNKSYSISPQITDENLDFVKYFLDGEEINFTSNLIESKSLTDGSHQLKIFAIDVNGFNSTKSFSFNVDKSHPTISIKSPREGTIVSDILPISIEILDTNLQETDGIKIILPDGEILTDITSVQYDTSQLDNGVYEIQILAQDKAGNEDMKTLSFEVDHSVKNTITTIEEDTPSEENYLLVIGIAIGLVIGIVSVLFATKKIKIPTTT